MSFFIGEGIDIHQLIKQKSQIKLGGFSFNSEWKIKAHSDGDVVLHSINNAILGALNKGDIGDYFPDTSSKNKNLDSSKILFKALSFLNSKQKIVNIDLTIICQNIIFKNLKTKIQNSLIKLIKCKHINVKCTRFEQKQNLICCKSIVLIQDK